MPWLMLLCLRSCSAEQPASVYMPSLLTVLFLYCRHDFHVTRPLLVVTPQSSLDFWEGEWRFWTSPSSSTSNGTGVNTATDPTAAAPASSPSAGAARSAGIGNASNGSASTSASSSSTVNMVVYSGSAAARTMLHEHELWLSPSALDRKGSLTRGREDCPQKVSRGQACTCAPLPPSQSTDTVLAVVPVF